MPIYEYHCNNCNHQFAKLQKISDAPLTNCPQCEKQTLQKLVSAAAFHLKGGGWYATDFKDKKQDVSTPNAASSEASAPTDGSKAVTTDSKSLPTQPQKEASEKVTSKNESQPTDQG